MKVKELIEILNKQNQEMDIEIILGGRDCEEGVCTAIIYDIHKNTLKLR